MKGRKKMQHVAEIPKAIVENPNWSRAHDGAKANPRLIEVEFNPRESAISALASHGAIDPHQVAAADEFRRLFESMGGVGARGLDTTKEFVDGGRFPDPIGQKAIDAGKKLAKAHEVLTTAHGLYGWKLVGYVCGEGRSIHELTNTRRERDTMTDRLRAALDVLAEHWGYTTGRR